MCVKRSVTINEGQPDEAINKTFTGCNNNEFQNIIVYFDIKSIFHFTIISTMCHQLNRFCYFMNVHVHMN